jgi:hypothetical protein
LHPQLSRFAIKLVASLLQSLPSGDNPRNPQQKWLRQVKDYQEKMPRTQNDTGRAYEYAIVNYFEKHGYVLGTLAKHHSSLYEDYFFAQTSKTQRDFQKSAADFYEWFSVSFGSKVSKCIDGLPDNSGSVVDVFIGEPGNEVNFSLKHNHLALRHNRPHGLPERCGISGTSEADEYLNAVYDIERLIRVEDPVLKFSELADKRKWMKAINDNCRKFLLTWQLSIPSTVPNYFGFLTGNDRPYYKLVLNSSGSNSGSYIHEFLSSKLPKAVEFSYNSSDHLVMDYDNGWILKKRLHNAQSNLGSLNLKTYSQTTDWKWDVSLVSQPNPSIYKI